MDKPDSNPDEASPKQNIGTKIQVKDFPDLVKAWLETNSTFKQEYEVKSLKYCYIIAVTCVFHLCLFAHCINVLVSFASSKNKDTDRYKDINLLFKTIS